MKDAKILFAEQQSENAQLREECEALRARVKALEAENRRLRAEGSAEAAPTPTPTRAYKSTGIREQGEPLWKQQGEPLWKQQGHYSLKAYVNWVSHV